MEANVMKKYIILAETGADLTEELINKYQIFIIPMHVTFGDETKADGSFPTTDLFNYYKKTGSLPKTAAANSMEFEEIYEKIHAEYPDAHILYLAYSAQTTSTYQNGVIAMEGRDYITAIDSRHVSAGQALFITLMARYIEKHPDISIEEIKYYADELSNRVKMGFFPGDLDYLRAGGRVSNAAYLGAKLLSLNPLIEIQHGLLIATKKYRGKMARIASKLTNDFIKENHLSKEILYFVYSDGLDSHIREQVEKEAMDMGFQEIKWIETGCVVSTHSGPGAFGIVGIQE